MFEWCVDNPEENFREELEWDRDWPEEEEDFENDAWITKKLPRRLWRWSCWRKRGL